MRPISSTPPTLATTAMIIVVASSVFVPLDKEADDAVLASNVVVDSSTADDVTANGSLDDSVVKGPVVDSVVVGSDVVVAVAGSVDTDSVVVVVGGVRGAGVTGAGVVVGAGAVAAGVVVNVAQDTVMLPVAAVPRDQVPTRMISISPLATTNVGRSWFPLQPKLSQSLSFPALTDAPVGQTLRYTPSLVSVGASPHASIVATPVQVARHSNQMSF